jgi:hypothetical protein
MTRAPNEKPVDQPEPDDDEPEEPADGEPAEES